MENTLLNSDEQKGKPVKAIIVSVLIDIIGTTLLCLLYTSPSPRDYTRSRMPSSA